MYITIKYFIPSEILRVVNSTQNDKMLKITLHTKTFRSFSILETTLDIIVLRITALKEKYD